MREFRVKWEIDVCNCTSPEEAAHYALRKMRNAESTAQVFTVTDPEGVEHHVDLCPDLKDMEVME